MYCVYTKSNSIHGALPVVQVSVYGVLGLGATVNPTMEDAKMIAPYFGDVNATSGHNVFYRSTNDSVLLQQVTNIITENFGESVDLHSLFIATWHHIPASGGPVDKVRLFTCTRAASCIAVHDMRFFSVGSRLKNHWVEKSLCLEGLLESLMMICGMLAQLIGLALSCDALVCGYEEDNDC